MTPIEVMRHFYALPRNTAEERVGLLAMLTDDVEYVGVGKESASGIAAVERLFKKYEGGGQTNITFDIKHIAADGDTVLIDMVDTMTIDGKDVSVPFFNVFKVRGDKIRYWQEFYDISRLESAFPKGIAVTERPVA